MIAPDALERLIEALRDRGYRVLGPIVRDGAIVYDDLDSAAELPIGSTDEQDGGSYRLQRRADEARFGYAVGPHSWKRFLFPPRIRLWRARRASRTATPMIEEEPTRAGPFAFVGVRSCELHAIEIQDRVFMGGTLRRPRLRGPPRGRLDRRRQLHQAGGTCFCASMGTGPKAERRLRPGADGAARRGAPLRSPRPAASAAPRSSPSCPAAGDATPTWTRPRPRSTATAAKMGRDDGDRRPPRPAGAQPRTPALGRGRRPLPQLRQLHPGLPDLLLLLGRGHHRPQRRRGGALARLGHLLLGRLLPHPRRQRPPHATAPATASG